MRITNRSADFYTWGNEDRAAMLGRELPVADLPLRMPQPSPITPGTRRGMISNSPLEPDPGSLHDMVLDRVSRQGFRVSARFMDILFSWWGPQPPLNKNLASDYRALGSHKGQVVYTDAFYDWRLRLYTISSSWGSLQNSRLSRAALEAPKAVKVTRSQWLDVLDIFRHEGWATTRGEAEAFLSTPSTDFMQVRAALAVIEYCESGKTAYLVEQDASCSGFQHMALLMRDRELARKVNATTNKKRQDLYHYVADICGIGVVLGLNDREARQWAKPVVMLTGYGSGANGIASRYWFDAGGLGEFNEQNEFQAEGGTVTIGTRTLSYEELLSLVKPMQEALFNEFPTLRALRNRCIAYFQECVKADPTRFVWTTPLGVDCVRFITPVEQETGGVKEAGAMPNLIHSLDACVVHLTVLDWRGTLGVVHDAFFTTADRVGELRECVQRAYQRVHEDIGAFPVGNHDREPLPIGMCIGV